MLKLIGVLIILVGFSLKLDTIAVVIVAGLATGIVAGIGAGAGLVATIVNVLSVLGNAFVSTRYMTLLLLTLAVVGVLERNGLRERAAICISKIKGATCGKVLSVYEVIRTIAAVLSLRIGGHVQFIRPLIYPMAKGAAEKEGKVTEEIDEEIKGFANAVENYGNFYGQNGFVAAGGVLLILGTMQELGVQGVEAYSVAKCSLIMAVLSVIVSIIRNYLFDLKIKRARGDK